VSSEDLYQTIIDSRIEEVGERDEENDPPASADDIPLSKTGSLFLFAARKISEILYESTDTDVKVSVFPEHAAILHNFVGNDSPSSIGTESESLLDAILCLGLLALEKNQLEGEKTIHEIFAGFKMYAQFLHTLP
jgi:hypothetical protein